MWEATQNLWGSAGGAAGGAPGRPLGSAWVKCAGDFVGWFLGERVKMLGRGFGRLLGALWGGSWGTSWGNFVGGPWVIFQFCYSFLWGSVGEFVGKYTEWDADGMPAKTVEGEVVSDKVKKKLSKAFEAHKKTVATLAEKGGATFLESLQKEIKADEKALEAAGDQ